MSDENGKLGAILVIDDDSDAQHKIISYLQNNDMHAVAARGPKQTIRLLAHCDPSLVILDMRAGPADRLELLRQIRSLSDVPVIITTDHRCGEMERVVGLDLGADDCLVKPVGLRELQARVRAVLRRQKAGTAASQRKLERGRFRFGGWQIDRRARRLTDPNGAPVSLTKSQYALLTAFLDAPQRPLSREDLLHATRVHEDVFDRSIDVQILRLRRKLKNYPAAPNMIRTERGVGYVFVLPVEAI
jgi:two-component system, OmpR family, response regulator